MDLRVADPDGRLLRLRRRRGLFVLGRREGAALHRHLIVSRARQRQRGPLRLELPLGRLELRLVRLERRALAIDLLRRHGAGLHQRLDVIVLGPGVVEVGRGLGALGLGRSQNGSRLGDLLGGLAPLITEGLLALLHLDGEALGALREVGLLGLELIGGDHREKLIADDRVALSHQELAHAASDLRAHDNVLGGHDPGQEQGRRGQREVPDQERTDDEHARDEEQTQSFHAVSIYLQIPRIQVKEGARASRSRCGTIWRMPGVVRFGFRRASVGTHAALGVSMVPMSRVGIVGAMLVVAVASCSQTDSQPEEAVTDAGCVASPRAGAACEPGIRACPADEPCQPLWSCDSVSHTWDESVPNCFAQPPACETPFPGGACDPGVPACPEALEAGCGPLVTWTCNRTTQQWDASITNAGCDAAAGRPADGALQDGASNDGEAGAGSDD